MTYAVDSPGASFYNNQYMWMLVFQKNKIRTESRENELSYICELGYRFYLLLRF